MTREAIITFWIVWHRRETYAARGDTAAIAIDEAVRDDGEGRTWSRMRRAGWRCDLVTLVTK